MIARLLSLAPSHPAVRLRKPAYLTAPDIVVVVVGGRGGLGNRREVEGRYVEWGRKWKGMDRRERDRERNPRGKVLASTTKSLLELSSC